MSLRPWLIFVLCLVQGACASAGPVLKPSENRAYGIKRAVAADGVTNEWLGQDPSQLAVLEDDNVTTVVKVNVGSKFISLNLQTSNSSAEARLVNPIRLTVLDAQRIQLTRARPDEVANAVASLVIEQPVFPPRYIISTQTSGYVTRISPGIATFSGTQETIVERDPINAAAESFARGFAAGFNRGVLETAERAYREGFTGPFVLQPRSGKQGRLYFWRPRGKIELVYVQLGNGREIAFRAAP